MPLAQCRVKGTEDSLRRTARDFVGKKRTADKFVKWANEKLHEREDCDLVLQAALSEKELEKRNKCQEKLPKTSQERHLKPISRSKYNVSVDPVTDSFHRKYTASAKLCSDLVSLKPKPLFK